jgi:hypothetical protein
VIRHELSASAEIPKGFVQTSQLTEEVSSSIGRVAIVGIELKRALKAQDCVVQTPAFDETSSQA